jgi:hypothetical protein
VIICLQYLHEVIQIHIAGRIRDKVKYCLPISFDDNIEQFLVFDVIFKPRLAPLLVHLPRVLLNEGIMHDREIVLSFVKYDLDHADHCIESTCDEASSQVRKLSGCLGWHDEVKVSHQLAQEIVFEQVVIGLSQFA